jgi:hypothetical protein
MPPMMERVQAKGGKARFVLPGAEIHGSHHSTTFDVTVKIAAPFLARLSALVGSISFALR